MSSRSATARIAASEIQPSCCSCTRHRIAIAAEACRPSGYLAICCFAQARVSAVNAKLAGCISLGARRRTDISLSLSLRAARGVGVQGIDPIQPERACGTEYIITDVGRNLDAVENGKLGDGFETTASGIVDDQLQRRLFNDIARHGMPGVVAVLFAQYHAVALQQPRAAFDGVDFDTLDIELDQVPAAGGYLAVVEQIVERDDRHFL